MARQEHLKTAGGVVSRQVLERPGEIPNRHARVPDRGGQRASRGWQFAFGPLGLRQIFSRSASS